MLMSIVIRELGLGKCYGCYAEVIAKVDSSDGD